MRLVGKVRAAGAAAQPGMSANLIVVLLAMQLGLQPVTTDLYLPALPLLTEELNGTLAEAQLTLSAMLLSFGISQIVWGQLSDLFGRRPILLAGLTLFVIGSLGCTFSQSLPEFILWRILTGFGLGAPIVCGRAFVRDLHDDLMAARVFSLGYTGVGIYAAVSLPLGGLVAQLFGWRMALGVTALMGAACLAAIFLRFEETLDRPDPGALGLRNIWRNWSRMLSDGPFLLYAGYGAASYLGLFTVLASSSFVFMRHFGHSQLAYGLLMLCQSLTFIGGAQLCRKLLHRVGIARLSALGGLLCLLGGALAIWVISRDAPSTWQVLGANMLYMLGHGVNQPCSQSLSIGRFPRAAGLAASLSGLLMTLATFAMGMWLGRHGDDVLAAMGLGLVFSGTLAGVLGGLVVRARRRSA